MQSKRLALPKDSRFTEQANREYKTTMAKKALSLSLDVFLLHVSPLVSPFSTSVEGIGYQDLDNGSYL